MVLLRVTSKTQPTCDVRTFWLILTSRGVSVSGVTAFCARQISLQSIFAYFATPSSFHVAHFHVAAARSDLHLSVTVFWPQEREEDQRILVLTFEALRLLGNAIVALSDLRLNLLGPVPRHLHVLRPFSHYAPSVALPGAVHHHIPVQVCTCTRIFSCCLVGAVGYICKTSVPRLCLCLR